MFNVSTFAQRLFFSGVITALPAIAFAASGATLRFTGTIVEPACAVSTSSISYPTDALTRATKAGSRVNAPLEVGVRCHAAQAVQLSFEQTGRDTRSGFDTGVAGVTMTVSRDGKIIPAGQRIPLMLQARSQQRVQLLTQLRRTAETVVSPQDRMRSSLLVSLNYQ